MSAIPDPWPWGEVCTYALVVLNVVLLWIVWGMRRRHEHGAAIFALCFMLFSGLLMLANQAPNPELHSDLERYEARSLRVIELLGLSSVVGLAGIFVSWVLPKAPKKDANGSPR